MRNWQAFIQTLEERIDPFGEKLAIEVSSSDNLHFSRNPAQPMLSASLIKLPILLHVLDESLRDPLLLEERVQIKEKSIVGGSGVLQVLSENEWPVRDLLALMISVSDNTATNLIIDHFGIDPINHWIRVHHLSGTRLERRLMDEAAENEGKHNLISAHDACTCMKRIFWEQHGYPEAVKSWFLHQQFRDKLPGLFDELPLPVEVYNKTGEMEEVDHDAAFFQCGSVSLILTVLTAGIADRQAVFRTIQTIGKTAADYLMREKEKM
ncbi:MAG: serine hydrolase [Sporolactobacillus sp.]